MKLLSWMQPLKQNGLIPSKKFKGGFCCLRAQVFFSDVQDIRTNSFSFSGDSHHPNPHETKEELLFDEEGFRGFLAIRMLGQDPETSKFSDMVAEEDIIGGEKDMAKLITEKLLDKFLEDQYSEDISSIRVQTLNAKEDRENNVCPLQGHDLFRSPIELTKRNNGGIRKQKGLLTRLFKRGESYIEKHGTRDVIKRVFEKLHGVSSKMRNDDDDSMPKKKDLRHSVQICQSKVHPVLYAPARAKNKIDDRRKLDLKVPTEGFLRSSSISKENQTKENWIKTDTAEYLILEL